MNWKAEWTGSYPNLCSGEWKLWYKGKRVALPPEQVGRDMNTLSTYSSWHFEDWMEVFEDYEDGMDVEEWVGQEWVKKMLDENDIPTCRSNAIALYEEINKEDWRHGSCGGCI